MAALRAVPLEVSSRAECAENNTTRLQPREGSVIGVGTRTDSGQKLYTFKRNQLNIARRIWDASFWHRSNHLGQIWGNAEY
jgi:hypothetical protein